MRFEHVNKSFGEKRVLVDLTSDIRAGAVTAIMGPSGCGKTTLGHILLGLLEIDSGRLIGFSELTKAAVFQEDRLIPRMSALNNLLIALPRGFERAKAEHALDRLGLFDVRHERVQTMSGGMKRRVAIARAILAKADLLVLDEPFKGLDMDTRSATVDYLRESTAGATVLLITHSEDEAIRLGAQYFLRLPAHESATF